MKIKYVPWIITGCYFLFGSLWILLSDTILYQITDNFMISKQIGLYKGWFFVLITCLLLYFLLKRLLFLNQSTQDRLYESEERYRRLVESSPYSIVLYQDGKIVYSNQAGLDMMGVRSRESLDEQTRSPVANQTDALHIRSILKQLQNEPEVDAKTKEYQIINEEGNIIDVESTFTPIFFKDKNAIIIQTKDITDQKTALKELWEAKQMIQAIISASPIAIVTLDLNSTVRSWNPAAEKIFGWNRHEIIGKPVPIVPEEEKDISIAEIVKHGHIVNKEVKRKRKDGSYVYAVLSTAPIQDEMGEINGIMAAFMDVTDTKKTEEALMKTEKLSAVGQLAASVAHEIRNPLTSVKGFIQLLQRDEEIARNAPYLSIILSEMDRMDDIIKDLLVLAKPQAERFTTLLVNDLLSYVVQLLNSQASLYNISFIMELTEEVLSIYGEENQLKQVFINLIKNAIEAMPVGGTVTIETYRDGDHVTVTIEDEGVGIPAHKIKTLGEPFYTTKEDGTGLGLLSSFRIIENHEGSLNFESKEGVGTKVTVSLPLPKQKGEGTGQL
ncbi:PAS domain-containing sensor histidine kinase [Guptibacillus algicola]|uniref:PAS domain-containing sensor histidine kinase n=1 Tax=Guptibacillus algicola TaxID=225844 RepID=UPI001CD70F1E|nr:PAS domain S-box protein [Alkalihalobacillus algicola]MCA0987669.1 PAS domain S-box protein [Alkalihalobacillus algicola]